MFLLRMSDKNFFVGADSPRRSAHRLGTRTDLCSGIPLRMSGCALAAYREDENGVDLGDMAIQGDMAVRAAPGHRFPLVVVDRPTNQRIVLQHIERGDDLADTRPESRPDGAQGGR